MVGFRVAFAETGDMGADEPAVGREQKQSHGDEQNALQYGEKQAGDAEYEEENAGRYSDDAPHDAPFVERWFRFGQE